MKALLQRVRQARVEVAGRVVGAIDQGLLVLLCAERGDTQAQALKLLNKVLTLRIFGDAAGKMNLSLQDLAHAPQPAGLLVVSQFTLAADCWGGRRPSFGGAAEPALARQLYGCFVDQARALHPVVATGEFGADMQVHLVNDGPVTIPIEIR